MAILFIYVSRECIFSVTSIWEIWPIFLTTTSSGSAWEGLRLAGARAPWTLIAWSVLLWALNCLGCCCRILSLHMNLFANLGGLINIAIPLIYLWFTIVHVWPVNANITGHKKIANILCSVELSVVARRTLLLPSCSHQHWYVTHERSFKWTVNLNFHWPFTVRMTMLHLPW